MWVLGIEHRTSCFQGEYSPNWAILTALIWGCFDYYEILITKSIDFIFQKCCGPGVVMEGWTWWHTVHGCVFHRSKPICKSSQQVDLCEFWVRLVYKVSSRMARLHRETLSLKIKIKKKMPCMGIVFLKKTWAIKWKPWCQAWDASLWIIGQRGPQNNTNHCYSSWLPSVTLRHDPIAEDTTYSDCRI